MAYLVDGTQADGLGTNWVPGETMCGTILTLVGGFVSGAVGWFASAFLTGPLRKFFDLRGEVVRQMARFANALPRWRELPNDPSKLERADPQPSKEDEARLDEAKKTLRDHLLCGFEHSSIRPGRCGQGAFRPIQLF
jgi:hypothetical protein